MGPSRRFWSPWAAASKSSSRPTPANAQAPGRAGTVVATRSCAASATDTGADLYPKRQQIIEPVFADTKANRRIDRSQRRARKHPRPQTRTPPSAGPRYLRNSSHGKQKQARRSFDQAQARGYVLSCFV
jgi:hypothetical protein